MHLILTGATGLVGSGVLDAMLKSEEITKISILSRRPVPMAANDTRVSVIIHTDFQEYGSEVLNELKGARGVVWALGISQLKVTKEQYVTITKDYALAAAKAFSKISSPDEPFRFIYVSGGGATTTPSSFTSLQGRVKGEAETALSELCTPSFHVESVRPVGIDPANHTAIKPFIPDPGLAYHMMAFAALPLIRTAFRSIHSPTEHLGPFLVGLAMGQYDKQLDAGGKGITKVNGLRILDNSAFRRLYGLT